MGFAASTNTIAFTDVTTFLGICVGTVAEQGYVSKANAEKARTLSTAQEARDRFFAGRRPLDVEWATAREILEWVDSQCSKPATDRNDYLVRLCESIADARKSGVTTRNYAMVASAIVGFENASRRANGAARTTTRPVVATSSRAVAIDATRIVALFAKAFGAGLRKPKIRLQVGTQPIAFAPAKAGSRNEGCIYVNDNGPYGSDVYFGKITPDGAFVPSRDCTDSVRDLIVSLAADPVAVARAYGKTTKHCCFCSTALTDGRSKAVGYGPICASNWSLPWGEVSDDTEQEVTLDDQ